LEKAIISVDTHEMIAAKNFILLLPTLKRKKIKRFFNPSRRFRAFLRCTIQVWHSSLFLLVFFSTLKSKTSLMKHIETLLKDYSEDEIVKK